MALTKSGTKKWVDSSDTGVIAETQPIPGPGQKGTIYIPKLMPFIQFGGLQKQANVTNGNMIFKNAPDCKPNAPTVVYTQNYITATAANDANWADVQGVSGYRRALCFRLLSEERDLLVTELLSKKFQNILI